MIITISDKILLKKLTLFPLNRIFQRRRKKKATFVLYITIFHEKSYLFLKSKNYSNVRNLNFLQLSFKNI